VTSVLVLAGGPDAEHQVSLASARGIADALREHGDLDVIERTIDRLTPAQLASMPGDVIFPALHGAYGEGGPLQDLLERDGRAYVGSGPGAARLAMDKIATKSRALRLGVPTPDSAVLDLRDERCPLALPVVLKPVHDGSSVGLHMCATEAAWRGARDVALADRRANPHRVYMVERMVPGARELTVGVLDDRALALIEIRAASGTYDYEAKYHRDDTCYLLDPELPAGVGDRLRAQALELASSIGVRHLARVDFMLDEAGIGWLLEVNTMPGFTGHSLVPMAARHEGMEMPSLCARLVELAVRDAPAAHRAIA
jgi:D-alanine-D-alanine ligase